MYEFIHRIPHEPWKKPSRNEDEYFRRLELEHRVEEARRRRLEEERRERERLQQVHRNHCPSCGVLLEPMRLEEGEVRHCPECRGVWLDWEVFQEVVPQERHEEALKEMLRAVMSFSLGEIPEQLIHEEGEKGTRQP